MKKTFLRVLCMALAIVMVAFMFVSCGSKTDDSKIEWAIGGVGPTSGTNASYGISVKQGAQIAVDEINAAGGINGYKINYKFEDDQAAPEQAVTSYNNLKDWGMKISLGAVTSGSCNDLAELAADDGMYLITPSASMASCIADKNAFRICFDDPYQGTQIAMKLKADYDLNGKKIGALYNSASDYSKGIYDAFIAELGDAAEVVSVTFTDDAQTVFTAEASQLADCDIVFLPIYYQAAAAYLKAAQSNSDVQYIGGDGLDGIIAELQDDVKLAEGLVLLTPFNATSQEEVVKNFVAEYQKRYNATPDQFAADAYDAVYAIKTALEQAKADGSEITPESTIAEISEAMSAVMTKITLKGTTGEMTWEASGAPKKAANFVTISEGQYK